MKFSKILASLIKEHQISLKDLSRMTGIPTSTLFEWCNGRIPQFSHQLFKISEVFNVTLDYLARGENHSKIQEINEQDDSIQFDFYVNKEKYKLHIKKIKKGE